MESLNKDSTISENTSDLPKKTRRWGRSLAKTGLWFCAAFFATAYIADKIPAYPIVVHTNSIDPGIYWLDTSARSIKRGDTVSFRFIPKTDQLKSRLGESGHTKQILGFPGETVKASLDGSYQVCSQPQNSVAQCYPVGDPMQFDSRGRPLDPWLSPGESLTLADDEYWVYAPNPRSLDSRYNGPVQYSQIKGKASPIYVWGSYLDD